ncbi:MAG: cytochrome C [Sideroxydans sp.]|nr:cytochrome C [Sideroxydans sp.]
MKRFAVALLLATGMNLVYAGSDQQPGPNETKWKKECGSCHVAYPPRLMSAENWQGLMDGLDKHFGSNASLDAKDNKQILAFLKRNASNGNLYSSSSLRISDTPWFKREHHVIAAKEWDHADVKSRSNCESCHGATVLGS